MAVRLSVAASPAAPQQSWVNRRVSIRKPPSPVASTQVADGISFRYRRALIRDLSASGIGLITRQEFPIGTHILIQIKNEILDVTYDLLAKVVHVSEKRKDQYILGCEFTRGLTQAELETML
jgi:hypothetical protein